jgi:large subunit ribosomal protein L17
LRGLVDSLVEHGRIKTTLPKAKELRRHVERAITLGKKQNLNSRRILEARYPFGSTPETICKDVAVRFKDRNGGYTRIIKIGVRPGDKAEMAFIEFVDYDFTAAAAKAAAEVKTQTNKEKRTESKLVQSAKKHKRQIQVASRIYNRA